MLRHFNFPISIIRDLSRIYEGCLIMFKGLRLHGNTHVFDRTIVDKVSILVEHLLGTLVTSDRTGTKRMAASDGFITVGLPLSLSKAVSVLDPHDGRSGAKGFRTSHLRMTVLIRESTGVS